MQTVTPRDINAEQLQLGSAATRMIAVGAVLALLGLGTACVLGLSNPESRTLFFHAYLVAFTFYLSITLGAMFFVMLHHLSRAGWSVTLRRLAEALSGNIGLMGLLFLPVLLGLGNLYEWSHPEVAETLGAKAAWLNPTAFLIRFVVYFAIWGLLVWYLRSRSILQDVTGEPRLSQSMERVSALGMILLGLTTTLASIDLLMSLNPHWTSTIFGVYFFTGSALAGLIVLTLLARWLQATGRLGRAVTKEHYHDLGKLTFAMVFFWGYVAFSQYMLIWYGNMPEETQFYMPRQIGPWIGLSLALIACHLLIPFVGLLSRHAKRNLKVFTFWALWLLAAHLLDLFWIVMPNLFVREIPAAVGFAPNTPLPEALKQLLASNQSVYTLAEQHVSFMHVATLPLQPTSLIILFGLVIGMGGLYLIGTASLLQRAALIPLEDPRLAESLSFENA